MAWSFDSFDREQPASSRRTSSDRIGDYVLVSELGHGGMATVFRARDERLQREIALKVIHPHLQANEEVAERFTREARAVARLKHPNIVEVYDVSGPDAREKYLVVELVDGPSLRQLLKALGKLPAEIAGCIGIELCGALAHAHSQGIVHRDVKPENVLVELPSKVSQSSSQLARDASRASRASKADAPPSVKLTDFGIAKVLDGQGVTVTGQVLGSPAHMAPEQIEGRAVDERTDVYALGVLLYECVAGRLPFDGSSPAQVLRAVLEGDCPALDQVEPRAGAVWGRIIAKAMCRDRDGRYASCDDFAEAIRAELERLAYAGLPAEFGAFLRDPETYRAEYEPRILARLMERGGDTATRGDRVSSVADLQRALAFRPDDAALMQQVHRAIRGGRRGWTWRVGAGAVAACALAAAIWGLAPGESGGPPNEPNAAATAANTRPATHVPSASDDVAPLPNVATSSGALVSTDSSLSDAAAVAAVRAIVAVAEPRPSVNPVSVVDRPERPAPLDVRDAAKKPPPRRSADTRPVEVRISGATGGSVKIDGKPVAWQGSVLELTTGPHRFEFVPPTEDCCLAPEPRTINVRPAGPGEGPQQITERIGFRPATLHLAGLPAAASIDCAGLLRGPVSPPLAIEIPMRKPRRRSYCTIRLPGGSPQVTKPVTLRAGQTTTLAL